MAIRASDDEGAAVVDFVFVGALLTLLFLGVLQVVVAAHVRAVLASCVAEGARYGANGDVGSADAGAARANELIRTSLGPSYAHAVAGGTATVDGMPIVTVVVHAHVPLLAWFLPIGPTVTAVGHAAQEPPA